MAYLALGNNVPDSVDPEVRGLDARSLPADVAFDHRDTIGDGEDRAQVKIESRWDDGARRLQLRTGQLLTGALAAGCWRLSAMVAVGGRRWGVGRVDPARVMPGRG